MAFQRVNMKSNGESDAAMKQNKNADASAQSAAGATPTEKFRMRVVPPQAAQDSSTTKSTVKEKNMTAGVFSRKMIAIGVVVVLVLGVGTGLAGAYLTGGGAVSVVPKENQKTASEVESAVRVGAVFGVPDEKTFRDDTEGVLIIGGLEGEGSHTLLRPGGVSQNVYLTSSVVDLDQFEGHRVRIWGETFKGQKAGWLMDVGRVEVQELDATKPEWYTESVGE